MAAIIHPLLTLLASLTRQELVRQVTYLKAENQTLRGKLPKRIELSNQERRRLVKHGKSLGARIKELISVDILRVGAHWYNHRRRGHSGLCRLPPVRDDEDPPVVDLAKHKLVCHTELGGNRKSYRAAT